MPVGAATAPACLVCASSESPAGERAMLTENRQTAPTLPDLEQRHKHDQRKAGRVMIFAEGVDIAKQCEIADGEQRE